jgi:hypothetical protein
MRTSRIPSAVLPVMAGVVMGVAGNLLVSRLNAQGAVQRHPAHSEGTAGVATPPTVIVSNDPRVESLEQRIKVLEMLRKPPSGEASESAHASSVPNVRPEEWKQHHEEVHAARIAEANTEPVDSAWASKTEALFETDLTKVAGTPESHGMSVVGVECRTTLCLATFEWPSFEAARSGYGGVLHASFQANCGREILLPPPKDPAAPYRTTAVLDCTDSRANENN